VLTDEPGKLAGFHAGRGNWVSEKYQRKDKTVAKR